MQAKIFDLLDKFKLPLALSLLGLVLIIGGIFASGLNKPLQKDLPGGRQDFPKESIVQAEKLISVDVSGAVGKEGVYQLKEGQRIEDAVNAAGGFSKDANQEYISKYINMAQKLVDGTKVYIPKTGDSTSAPSTSGSAPAVAGVAAKNQININTASQSELEALPGIGPVTAAKIISNRSYQTADELLSKKVVSKAVFEKIKDQVVIY